MSKPTLIGANTRNATPGGFTKVKRRSKMYRELRAVKEAANAFIEKRGLHNVPDLFSAHQRAHMAEARFSKNAE